MKLKKALSGILCMAMICLLLPVMPQSGGSGHRRFH